MVILFSLIMGLVVGSFLGALTWRSEKGISIAKGRSFCPHCNHTIAAYDNIPVLSYLLLGGKCRNCKKHISLRYPLIELSTAVSFAAISFFYPAIVANFTWLAPFGLGGLFFMLFLSAVSIGIVVTDLEDMIIPDEFVFAAFTVSIFMLMLSPASDIWLRLLLSFSTASVFLLLNLITKGRGMGLGDVKLALIVGLLLPVSQILVWFFVSFVSGATIGVLLIVFYKASNKTKIPFGPFMVFGLWVAIFFGAIIAKNYLLL